MKKSRLLLLFSIALLGLMSTSCVTSKKVRYLRDMPTYGIPLNENYEAVIVPYDELRIYVMDDAKNEELVKPFNVMGTLENNNNGNVRTGYLVDVKGNIEFPVLGKLHVEGLTRLQLQEMITSKIKENGYLSNPSVIVRFMNFKVFFLGTETGKVINIENERCTFLEALSMAGGVDLYTRRDRIGVMRQVNGKMVIHYLDPRSSDIFDDDFFLLQQNDIIFTEANSRRFLKEAYSNWSLLLSSITSLGSLAALYLTISELVKNKR